MIHPETSPVGREDAPTDTLSRLKRAKPSSGRVLYDDPGFRVTVADLLAIPLADLYALGFGNWTEESGLILIPDWAYWLIADGETLTDISDEQSAKGADNIDLDTRFGCIAFGFVGASCASTPGDSGMQK
jgi:hypothetical protein